MAGYKGGQGPTAKPKKVPTARPKRKGKRGKGNGWGLFGIAASIIAVAAVAAFRLTKKSRLDRTSDRLALRHMLLRPLQITDHGACRMDCR